MLSLIYHTLPRLTRHMRYAMKSFMTKPYGRQVEITCAHCGKIAVKSASAVNRARRQGAPIYCGRQCFQASRTARVAWKTDVVKKQEKAAYDRERRARLADQIKAEKAAYHKRTYDPDIARVRRKKNMARHVEYCRQPEYKEYKRSYDKRHRATKEYGEFAECFLIADSIRNEVLARSSAYEIYYQKGRINRTNKNKREHTRTFSSSQCEESENSSLGNPVGIKNRSN